MSELIHHKRIEGAVNGRRILRFLAEYIERERWSPSITEIAEALDLERSTIHRHLNVLERHGLIERKPPGKKQIRLKEAP